MHVYVSCMYTSDACIRLMYVCAPYFYFLCRCYPFTDEDPFCIPGEPHLAPHVIFSAGHSSFECRQWNNNQWQQPNHNQMSSPVLITIPKFSGFKQLILIDLSTLRYHLVTF